MVLGLLTLTAIPTVIGVAQGVSSQREENNKQNEEKQMAKFNLEAECDDDGETSGGGKREKIRSQINGKIVVLRDGKAWLDEHSEPLRQKKGASPAKCFYIAYPDDDREKTLGLVSYLATEPPSLNWLYVDSETYEVKHGNRTTSRPHIVGPWDWTMSNGESENGGPDTKTAEGEDGEGLVLDAFEGFVAVEEDPEKAPGEWALYFDRNDDGFLGVPKLKGKRKINIFLKREMIEEDDPLKT